MNHKDVIDVLIDCERRMDVNSLWLDGVQLWPLLRREIWMYLLSVDETQVRSPITSISPKTELRHYTSSSKHHRTNPQSDHIRILKNELDPRVASADILFWSRKEDHTETFSEGVVDRVIDPLIWDVRDQGYSTIKLSASDGIGWNDINQLEPSIFIRISRLLDLDNNVQSPGSTYQTKHGRLGNFLNNILSWFQSKYIGWSNQRSTLSITAFLKSIKETIPGNPLTYSQITSMVRRFNARADLFDVVLDLVKPQLVMLAVFYSSEAMPLIHACRRKGIPVVDIQHGKQGLYHGMYGNWSCLPDDNYSVLPDWFWTWGRESADNIRKSLPSNARRPKTVVGGNRWMAQWRSGLQQPKYDPNIHAVLDRTEGFENRILVTLQPLSDPLPLHLIEAMRRSPNTWYWFIKTHPHHRQHAFDITTKIEAAGVKNYSVDVVSCGPLYPWITAANVHITCWSSVAYEALSLGTPTILIHQTAQKLYSKYIEQGYFSYADNYNDIIKKIQYLSNRGVLRERTPYIETSDAIARSAVNICLSYTLAQGIREPTSRRIRDVDDGSQGTGGAAQGKKAKRRSIRSS